MVCWRHLLSKTKCLKTKATQNHAECRRRVNKMLLRNWLLLDSNLGPKTACIHNAYFTPICLRKEQPDDGFIMSQNMKWCNIKKSSIDTNICDDWTEIQLILYPGIICGLSSCLWKRKGQCFILLHGNCIRRY